jgi:tetratricopeptide (TPR) repeat protein
LGILDGIQNRTGDARGHYEEALQAYRQLARQDQDTYLPYLAATLNNLALVDETEKRMENARAHYNEALDCYRTLFQGEPDRYAGDVARVEGSLEAMEKKAPSQ